MRMTLALLFAFVATTSVASADDAIQSTTTVNVRSGPGTGYGIIGQVPTGHVYVAFASSGAWRKIYYDGGTGWTHGDYYATLSGTTGVRVTTDVLNVRSGPGTGYGIIGQVYMNQVYFWTQYAGLDGWYKIYFDGGIGYSYGGYLTQVALGGGSAPPPPSGTTDLPMTHYYQQTSYTCGPTTAQMVVKYVSGTLVAQSTIAAYCGTTPSAGTSNYMVKQAINYYGGAAYVTASYNGQRIRDNISANRPSNCNMKCSYLAYWGYAYALHHSPAKGFTSGGFYIHDSWKGPQKWASSTELYNAVVYHYNLTAVRY